MSKYDLNAPNRTYNDWDTVEQQILNGGGGGIVYSAGNGIEIDASHKIAAKVDNITIQFDADGKLKAVGGGGAAVWGTITGTLANQTDLSTALGNKVDKEVNKGLISDTEKAQITTNADDILDLQANKANQSALNTEITNRTTADTTLQNNINAEATTRETNDTTLQTNIDNEATIRETADTVLQDNIDTEETARTAADTLLQNAIDDEVENRQNGDDALQTAINNIINDALTSGTTTYSSDKIQDLLDALSGRATIIVVDTLPAVLQDNTLYYVGTESPYHIWLRSAGTTYDMGTTTIDLSNYIKKSDIVDSLVSTETQKPLSANQGKVLNDTLGNKANSADLTTEITNRTNADTTLQDNIDAEETRALAAEALKADVATTYNKTEVDDLLTNKVNTADIVDALNSTDADKPLSAKQGKALKAFIGDLSSLVTTAKDNLVNALNEVKNDIANYVLKTDIVDDLNSTDNNKPLSANQGRLLNRNKIGINNAHSDQGFDIGSQSGQITIYGDDYDVPLSSLQTVYDLIYPVGYIHMGFSQPATTGVTATWQDVSSSYDGRYFKVDSTKAVGTSEAQELPNIRGSFDVTAFQTDGDYPIVQFPQGAFVSAKISSSDVGLNYSSPNRGRTRFSLDASQSNATYKDGGAVKPLTTTIKVYQRTA